MKEAIGVVLATIIVLLDLNNVLFKRLCAFGTSRVAPFRLGSGLLTSGKVARAPELPNSNFTFSFLLEWSCD